MAITSLYTDLDTVKTAQTTKTAAATVGAGYPDVTLGASTAAAGSSSTDFGALPAGTGNCYPTTAADDAKGVGINAAENVTGRMIFIGNKVSNKILKVYPPAGGTINGGAANAAYSSSSGGGVIIICEDSTANTGAGAFLAFG